MLKGIVRKNSVPDWWKKLVAMQIGAVALVFAMEVFSNDYPLVYSFQPRDTTPIEGAKVGGKPVQIDEGSTWQWKMDAGRFYTFTESDVVYNDFKGNGRFLTRCTLEDGPPCAGQSATVSADAQWIVYQKSFGHQLLPIRATYTDKDIQDKKFTAHTTQLFAYNIKTDTTTQLTQGYHDITPKFCGDRLIWASNRFGTYPPYQYSSNIYPHRGTTIVSASWKDGKLGDIKNLTPHEMLAMSPECLTNGYILYSSYQGYSKRGRYEFNSTPQNVWWLNIIDANGANALTIASAGAHNSPYIPTAELIADELSDWGGARVSTMLILRPVRQVGITADGEPYVCVGSYYRTNHVGGFGELLCYTVKPYEGVSKLNNWVYRKPGENSVAEGSGAFVPENLRSLTPWGHGFDNPQRFDKQGRIMGKANYAAPYPGGKLLITWARGVCYEAALVNGLDWATRERLGGEPLCQPTICLLPNLEPTSNPHKQCETLVGGKLNEDISVWDAHVVATHEELFGVPAPVTIPPLPRGAKTELRVVDFGEMELTGKPTGDPNQAYKNRMTNQGHATPDVKDRMDQFCLDEIEPWDTLPTRQGYKSQTLLGCQAPLEDGSIRMEVPPNKLIIMYGIDSTFEFPEGREPTWQECIEVRHGLCIVAEDQMLHSLREGEKRTCHGCHDAHGKFRWEQVGKKTAEQRFRETLSAPPGC